MKKLLILIVVLISITGCGDKKAQDSNLITGKEAQVFMEKDDAILVDVRTDAEYDEGHIDGAILIPVNTPKVIIERKLKDKDARIIVYCRSGNRSKEFVSILKEMGYTRVYDLGAKDNWSK